MYVTVNTVLYKLSKSRIEALYRHASNAIDFGDNVAYFAILFY